MDDTARDQLASSLHERQGTIAEAWYAAIARSSFVPLSQAAVRERLFELVGRAIQLLLTDSLEPEMAEPIGTSLASLHYTQPEALGRTQGVLAMELLRGIPPDQVIALRPPLARLMEGVATGFGRETTAMLLREQEEIRQALLTELRAAEKQLRAARDHLEEEVAQRTEELRESEERWRTLVANSPDPVLTLDREGRVLFVNYVRPESGLTLADVLGQPALERVFADQFEPARAVLRRVFETGESIVHEIALRRPDGAAVWYAAHAGPLERDGQVEAVLVVARDITERKRIEEALHESEERWRSLVANAPDLIYTVDGQGRIQYVNRLPPETPLRPEDVIGRNICDYVLPEHREVVEKALEHVFSAGTRVRYEAAMKRASGATSWYSSHMGPLWHDGQVVSAMLISRDVTEQKSLEAALQESEERWRTLVTHAPDVIFTLAPGGRIVYVNHFPGDALFDHRTIVGQNVFDLAMPDEVEAGKAAIQEVFATGSTRRLQVRAPTRPGIERWYSAVIGPVWQGSAITSVIVIARDITERKRTEEMKDNLLRDVAHELRTPLSRAQFSLEMMLESVTRSPIDDKGAARYGRLALENIQQLTTTVRRILDLSRLEAGVGTFAHETIHLADLVGAVARDMEPWASEKGLRLVIRTEGVLPVIMGDQEQISRVLRNLIDNACKFSTVGEIIVSAGKQGDEVVVSVSDQGCGILPENLNRVFDRFFTEDTSRDGVGVGLPMCKAILQAHNGRIWAESRGRGLGATLRFALPIERDNAEEPHLEEEHG